MTKVEPFDIPSQQCGNVCDQHDHIKGPVKLMQRVKISHLFLVCVKSVPCYHFKFVYAVLQMAVKEFFETHF